MNNSLNQHLGKLCILSSILLTACSGLPGASSKFACQAPENVSCNSVLGTYLNTINVSAQKKFVNTQQRKSGETSNSPVTDDIGESSPVSSAAKNPNINPTVVVGRRVGEQEKYAIDYAPAQTLRMWISPYVDAEDNYLGSRFVYLVIRHGGWSPYLPRADRTSSKQGLLVKRASDTGTQVSKESTKPDSRTQPEKTSPSNSTVSSSGVRAIISPATSDNSSVNSDSATSQPSTNFPSAPNPSGSVPSFLAPR